MLQMPPGTPLPWGGRVVLVRRGKLRHNGDKRVEEPEPGRGLCLKDMRDPCPSALSPYWHGAPGAPLGFQRLECQSDEAGHAAGQRVALQPHEASEGRGAAPHRGPHLRPVQPLGIFGAQVHQDLRGDNNTVSPKGGRGTVGWAGGVALPSCQGRGLRVAGWGTHLLEGHGQVWLRHPQHPGIELPHCTHPHRRLIEAGAGCNPGDGQERDGGRTSGVR